MVIRRKMFIIIVSTFTGLILIFALSGFLLLRGFTSAEDQEVRSNALRAGAVFTSAIDNLGVKVHDWSAWDDTYAYIQDHNAEYVKSNLTSESLQSVGVNMIIFIDRAGKVVKSKSINTTTLRDVPVPAQLTPYLKPASPLIQYDDLEGVRKGVIALPQGLLMVAARPIETSKQEGPTRGTIVFAKYVDEAFVAGLARTIDFPLRIEPYNSSSTPTDFLQVRQLFEQGDTTAVLPVDQNTIAGFVDIHGVDGQPAVILRATMSRSTLALGRNTIITYLLFILLTLIVISVGMWILIEKFVLSRMSRLTALVAASKPTDTAEIVLPGSDEFSHLAGVINALTAKLQLIDKAKTEFVSLASHQLRTPLTAINWYTEMLLAGDAGKVLPKQKKYLKEIYSGNQRMVGLVNALLSASRLELGTFVFEPEPTDVGALVQSTIAEQKVLLRLKKIQFSTTMEKGLPRVYADPKLLRVIVQNLLSNAIKYTPEDGSISLTVSVDEHAQQMLILVSDTGYGIPKSQQDKIFSKLFRADNARMKDAEGTGLGLYIVKSIVEHAGGTVSFTSEENKGSVFTVALPLKWHDTIKENEK